MSSHCHRLFRQVVGENWLEERKTSEFVGTPTASKAKLELFLIHKAVAAFRRLLHHAHKKHPTPPSTAAPGGVVTGGAGFGVGPVPNRSPRAAEVAAQSHHRYAHHRQWACPAQGVCVSVCVRVCLCASV